MSWSGPVAGAAPYQTPPYASGQPGYGQHPPYQHGPQAPHGHFQTGPAYPGPSQRPHDNRPPKKKGNPIITRYPPPPGYRGPAHPQGPFNIHQPSAQYQQPPQPGFPQGPPSQAFYPAQGYVAGAPQQGYPPQSYGPVQPNYPGPYPQGQTYQWPQQAYQAGQGGSQAPAYPSNQSYGTLQTSYQQHPAHTVAAGPSQQGYSQAPGWSAAHAQAPTHYPPYSQYNAYSGPAVNDHQMVDPNATPTQATAQPAAALPPVSTAHDSESGSKSELYLAWDDWDFDFDGAIWPKSNEPVDPNLSLGVIIWHPAKQMTRALPATFEEAEEHSLKPTPEKLCNGESVSIYFTAENSHEAFLDVRQTDEWDYIRDDPVFVVFTDEEMQHNLVPLEDCIAQRDRPDESTENLTRDEDSEMCEADWSVMDNLEQALSGGTEDSKPTAQASEAAPPKLQTQEDILAALGVTGQPKPVSGEAMPFLMPTQEINLDVPLPDKQRASPPLATTSRGLPEPQRTQSLGGSRSSDPPVGSQQRPYGSMSAIARPPPPPPPPGNDRYDPWNPSSHQQHYHPNGFNGGRGSPARSEASDGTAAGSDFGTEKPADASEMSHPPGSKFERSDSSVLRKRSYGDTGADDDRQRHHDDLAKRKRRLQVDAAYGRR